MNPFKFKSRAGQIKQYISNLTAQLRKELSTLDKHLTSELKFLRLLSSQRDQIAWRIGKLEDRIANVADKKFGDRRWRRNITLRDRVYRMMVRATDKYRARALRIQVKMDDIITRRNANRLKIQNKYKTLLNKLN